MSPHLSLLVLVGFLGSIRTDCPCPDSSLCQPVQRVYRHEKVAFMIVKDNWRYYDYSQLTTIVICTDDFDPQLVCLAHSREVRLVWIAGYDVQQLGNATARQQWIDTQIDRIKRTYTDGVNFDVEEEIAAGSPAVQQYTQLVQDLTEQLHREVPGSKVNRTFWLNRSMSVNLMYL